MFEAIVLFCTLSADPQCVQNSVRSEDCVRAVQDIRAMAEQELATREIFGKEVSCLPVQE